MRGDRCHGPALTSQPKVGVSLHSLRVHPVCTPRHRHVQPPVTAIPFSTRSYEAIGAAPVERSIYDHNLPTFQGWLPKQTKLAKPPTKSPETQETSTAIEEVVIPHSFESLHCSVTHPGSLTCTEASVTEATDKVVLAIKATIRKTERGVCNNIVDLEELGWLALKQTISQRTSMLKQTAALPGQHDERHQQVVKLLKVRVNWHMFTKSLTAAEGCCMGCMQDGVIIDAVKNGTNSFGHITYVVTLEDPQTRQRCRALFKPTLEGDGDGWHRVPIEAAAYQLNLLLGMDYVPPAVFRSTADVDWQRFDKGGVFIYWCPGSRELANVPVKDWDCRQEVLLSDTRILDVLIQNSDRHAGHFMLADHWSRGSYKGGRVSNDAWKGRKQPILIDQAAGFRSEAFVCMEHENAFETGPTLEISAKTYMRLRFLNRTTATAALGEYVTEEEISQLLKRKDSVLEYFDKLVGQKGYNQVVLEESSCDVPAMAQ